jgi:hypothetical protein
MRTNNKYSVRHAHRINGAHGAPYELVFVDHVRLP